MKSITHKMRSQYERYPYPTRFQEDLADGYPQLALSYREGYRLRENLHILDAGCGTGKLSLGTALHNPSCSVVAVDINRVALADLEKEAAELGLHNLKSVEADLLTLEGLDPPEGGFDVIFCGGVIHHLADRTKGLRNLVSLLAPHGVMRLMVYNTLGRQALYRFVRALDIIHRDRDNLSDRLILGREFMQSIKSGPVLEHPWQDGGAVSDVEFVDRYLNLNDTSYSLDEFLALLKETGLTFLRWHEPQEWDLASYLKAGDLLDSLQTEPEVVKCRLVEQLSNRVMMDAYVAHQGSVPQRAEPGLSEATVAVNPQVTLQVCHQSHGSTFQEVEPRAYLRGRYSVPLSAEEYAILKELSSSPRPVAELASTEPELDLLKGLLRRDLLYRYNR